MDHYECPLCGLSLDPNEKCDCEETVMSNEAFCGAEEENAGKAKRIAGGKK